MHLAAFLLSGMFPFLEATPPPGPVARGELLGSVPVQLWSVRLPGVRADAAVASEPAGVVVDGPYLYVGASGARGLLVLHRGDGSLAGILPSEGAVASNAVVGADRVWFSDDAGYTWSYPRPATQGLRSEAAWSHFSGAPILSSPTLDGADLLLANVDEQVYALDAATGTLRWRHAHKVDAARHASLELFGTPAPVVTSAGVLAGFSDGFLVALDRATGAEAWRASVGEGTYPDLIAPPLALGDAVLVAGFSDPLVSLDPVNRAVRWRIEAGSASALAVAGDRVWQGGSDGTLRGLDPRTGEVQVAWASPAGGTLTRPVPTEIGVFVGSSLGSLYLVDGATGALRWTFNTGELLSGVTAAPAVDGDLVYFVTNAGRLYALRGPATTRTPGS